MKLTNRQMGLLFEDSIQMNDLYTQYRRLKKEIDPAVISVLEKNIFVNGPQVDTFASHLASYMNTSHVLTCANGTNALQIALMALGLQAGNDVIVPAFTHIAAAEVVAMLGMTPVLVDVDPRTFTIDPQKIEHAVSRQTRAIIAVHLFGQSCEMEPILRIANKYNLAVIEDTSQALGSEFTFRSGEVKKTGTVGHIGTLSFSPTQPLGGYGDGGALMTDEEELAAKIRMVANHGQESDYCHQLVGCNSRLDSIQAAVLDVKLKYFDGFTEKRIQIARKYNEAFKSLSGIIIPYVSPFSTHIYHRYTIQVKEGKRDQLKAFLEEKGIPSRIYYPTPIENQPALRGLARKVYHMPVAIQLAGSVLSLPIHSEMTDEMVDYVIDNIHDFFK